MRTIAFLLPIFLLFGCNNNNTTTIQAGLGNSNSTEIANTIAAVEGTNVENRQYTSETVTSLDQSTLQVLSAVIKDKHIEGAEVLFQRTGKQSKVVTTNAQGLANIPADFINDTESMVIIKKEGYSTLVAKCPCKGLTYAISPKLKNLDGVRVVLNWGLTPRDLDLHVRYNNSHIFYSQMNGDNVNLDVDDTDSYGPETITIDKKLYNTKYSFFIHDYSNSYAPNKTQLANSQAKAYVYMGATLIRTFSVPTNYAGNVWHIFDLTEEGQIRDINRIVQSKLKSSLILEEGNYEYVNQQAPIAAARDAVVPQATTPQAAPIENRRIDLEAAANVNKEGEKTYREGDLSLAIDLFREAIEYDPDFGQAYSNLGLVYYKNGNKAEAIWANRKAISLAHGDRKDIVKASSFFNIAKIYEDDSDYEEALRYYRFAKESNDREAYDKAIARVTEMIDY